MVRTGFFVFQILSNWFWTPRFLNWLKKQD